MCVSYLAQGLLSAFSCARDLAESRGIAPPYLILTDNSLLRQQLQQGLFKDFATTPFMASHAGAKNGTGGSEALMTSFVDLSLMASATCLIGSPSGFTYTSVIWGRHDCFITIKSCIAMYGGSGGKRGGRGS